MFEPLWGSAPPRPSLPVAELHDAKVTLHPAYAACLESGLAVRERELGGAVAQARGLIAGLVARVAAADGTADAGFLTEIVEIIEGAGVAIDAIGTADSRPVSRGTAIGLAKSARTLECARDQIVAAALLLDRLTARPE